MHSRLRPALAGSAVALTFNAFAVTAVASAAPGPGGIPLRVIRNQLQYCSVICPDVVRGAATVPVAIGSTPVTLAGALLSSGSPLRAAGTTAASVTAPALAAFDPIITNDLSLVLPKAQNALQVSAVELINVGLATGDAGDVLQAIGDARTRIAGALDQPVGDPVGPTGAVNLPQVVVVEAINVGLAVAFQATEAGLLDVVKTADHTARTLASTGNVAAAAAVGVKDTTNAATAAGRTVTDSVTTAARRIRSSLRDPFPAASDRSAIRPASTGRDTDARRLVDRIVRRATAPGHTPVDRD